MPALRVALTFVRLCTVGALALHVFNDNSRWIRTLPGVEVEQRQFEWRRRRPPHCDASPTDEFCSRVTFKRLFLAMPCVRHGGRWQPRRRGTMLHAATLVCRRDPMARCAPNPPSTVAIERRLPARPQRQSPRPEELPMNTRNALGRSFVPRICTTRLLVEMRVTD
jgi:hypothetical protein